MINGTHVIIYTADAEAARAFFRDVLDFPHVDAGGGWLIFKTPPAELGIHPVGPSEPGESAVGGHELYLMCDDIETTVEELAARGVEFSSTVADQGFGLLTHLRVPGGGEVGLYQPHHPTAYDLDS